MSADSTCTAWGERWCKKVCRRQRNSSSVLIATALPNSCHCVFTGAMSTVVGGGVLATTSCAADVAEDTDGSSRGLRAIRSSLSSSAFLFAGALQDVLVMLTMSPAEEGVEGATNFVGCVGVADGRCLFSLVSSPLAVCKGNGETVWTAAASVASEGLASWSRFLLLRGASTDGSLFSCDVGNAVEARVGATGVSSPQCS